MAVSELIKDSIDTYFRRKHLGSRQLKRFVSDQLKDELIKVFTTMVESEIGLFQMQVKESSTEASEFVQAHFGIRPETLYTVNVVFPMGEVVLSMIYSVVPFEAQINPSIVTFPPIGRMLARLTLPWITACKTALEQSLDRLSLAF